MEIDASATKNVIPIHTAGIYNCLVMIGERVEKSTEVHIVEKARDYELQEKGDVAPLDLKAQEMSTEILELDKEHLSIDRNEPLGSGTFGTVFKGKWMETHVAIKEVPMLRKAVRNKEISREVEMHSKLRHPNITQLIGYTFSKKGLLLVSEFIEGEDLEHILFDEEIKSDFSISNESKKKITKEICQAIAYLHGQKFPIIHRH